ncbi:MAG: serine--tRNA ligase [Nitrospirota bacterium]
MLDIKLLRENLSLVQSELQKRSGTISFDRWIQLDTEERQLKVEIESLQAEKNRVSKEIGMTKMQTPPTAAVLEEMKQLAQEIEEKKAKRVKNEEERGNFLLMLPNIPNALVPIGKSEHDNIEVRQQGQRPLFLFSPKSHWEIGEKLGILDFERAAKMSGARYAIYQGLGARLERALINFMLDLHQHRYKEIIPPLIVNRESMIATGQLPKFEDDLFHLDSEDAFLIPTAEVPLTNLHRGEILSEAQLPLRYVAYTPCFRREAGSYGKDTKGLIRQHQFNKVELVTFSLPDQSYALLEQLVLDAEEVLKRLNLHYRVVSLCTGDLGFSSAKTYDIEVWLPEQAQYREISSCSNFESFQARRADIRYRTSSGKTEYVHTINGSGLAVGRTVVAILENYQQADGSVVVPEVLRPYLGGVEKIV